MDALQALYDSQVSEDEAVEVLQCSQQYDEPIDLDTSAFRVVSVVPAEEREAPRQIEDIVQLPKNHQWLAVDVLNAYNVVPQWAPQPAEEPEAQHEIEDIVPFEGIAPDDERNVRPLLHRMTGRSRSRSAGRREVEDVYVPQLDVDNLPTRIHDPHRQRRSVPEGRPPKAIRGLLLDELATLIRRCGLEGAWRHGGKQSRAVFVGDKFIINQEKSSTWAQGVRAQEIDARLRAARRSGQ